MTTKFIIKEYDRQLYVTLKEEKYNDDYRYRAGGFIYKRNIFVRLFVKIFNKKNNPTTTIYKRLFEKLQEIANEENCTIKYSFCSCNPQMVNWLLDTKDIFKWNRMYQGFAYKYITSEK